MIKELLKQLEKNIKVKTTSVQEFFLKYFLKYYRKVNLSKEIISHIQNILILFSSYSFVSIVIYPEFDGLKYIKEIFSLTCIYCAIFLWFIDHITISNRYKIIVGVTTIFAPILFMNNTFAVAIIGILVIIIFEYIVYEYFTGCNLFSALTPVYVVCNNYKQIKEIKNELNDRCKIIGFALIQNSNDYSDNLDIDINEFKFHEMEDKLQKLNRLFFLPFPREILYFKSNDEKDSAKHLILLSKITAKFSIKLFKIVLNEEEKDKRQKLSRLTILPVTIRDLMNFTFNIQLKPKEKTLLNSSFKNSRVWIFFDGRETIADLIQIISSVASVDLTIFCDSGYLSNILYEELEQKRHITNYKIKIADISMLALQETKPDIIFYNMPVKDPLQSEYSLKEVLVKNVLCTKTLIEYAQNNRVKHVFVISSNEASNASNWVGATQRLGELLAQQADFKNKKLFTKFKVIRIPSYITNKITIFAKIASSISLNGYIDFHFSKNENPKLYKSEDILRLLLKLIFTMLKEDDPFFSVYTISPETNFDDDIENLVQQVSSMFGIKSNDYIKIKYNSSSEEIDLEKFPNITEEFENTDIPNVTRTKLLYTKEEQDEYIWNIENIRNMKTRELFSTVFQAINKK